MHSRRFVLAAALLCPACGKPPAAPSREPRFAIALPVPPPHHTPVYDNRGTYDQLPFSSLTEDSVLAQTTDAPVTLRLEYSAEGSRARIVSYAIYQSRTKRLGDHRARLNESVRLAELQKLGYLPFTVRVLPATPPARPQPALSSDAPSIHLEFVKQNWDSFTLAVHNLSPHAVVAYASGQVRASCGDDYIAAEGTASYPAIPAGATVTDERFEDVPIVIRAVLFDDGSWEGDPAIIATLKGRQAAREALRGEINEMAARILADTSLDDETRIARIRSGIDALPEKPAPALIRQALAGLPVQRLSDTQQHALEYSLHNFKWSEANQLSQFNPGRRTLAQFWAATHHSQ